jgi:hypothetical protein
VYRGYVGGEPIAARAGRASVATLLPALLLGASGCTLDDLPACDPIEIAIPRSSEISPTVLAYSRGNELFVLDGCDAQTCSERLVTTRDEAPEQLLLTGSGRWLTWVSGSELLRIDLAAPPGTAPITTAIDATQVELIGSLRGGDWIVFRSWAQSSDPSVTPSARTSELFARYVGDDAAFPFDDAAKTIRIDAGEFRVVALGHRNLVVRKSLGEGREALYLVRIAPSFRQDEHGAAQIGETLLLAHGPAFSRVLVVSGRTPDELGDLDAFPQLANDTLVLATSGTGPHARTLVYDIRNLDLVANFEGALATSLLPLQDVSGLRALAPDQRHVAYVTPTGALALRDLDTQLSCALRAGAGQVGEHDQAEGHVVAGFANDGTLYVQSRERGFLDDLDVRVREFDRVYAIDTATQHASLLSESPNRLPLRAVPHGYVDAPWAVVASSGNFATLTGFATSTGTSAIQSIGFEDAAFLGRDAASLWVLGADARDEGYRMQLRRVSVAQGLEHSDLHEVEYADDQRVCVSIAQASHGAPWATQCGHGALGRATLSDALPSVELRD